MSFSVFPDTNMLFVFNMRPNGPNKTAESYVSDSLNPEDIQLVEAVHRGLKSKGYNPGRLIVDEEQKAPWGEQFIHHFNQFNLAALNR